MAEPEHALAEDLKRQLVEGITVRQELLADTGACVTVAQLLIDTYRAGGCLFAFGNGGSAADAQHIAAEFVGRFYIERPALPAHALTVNTSALTAIANDYGYEHVFSRQLSALGRPGDVALGISTSGNAANVVMGLEAAREKGMRTIALTGSRGGRARDVAEHWVGVPSNDTPRIQEVHITLGHIWSAMVESALYGDSSAT